MFNIFLRQFFLNSRDCQVPALRSVFFKIVFFQGNFFSELKGLPSSCPSKKNINTTSWEQQMSGGTTWEGLQRQNQKSFRGVFFQEKHSHRALAESQALPSATLSLPLTGQEAGGSSYSVCWQGQQNCPRYLSKSQEMEGSEQ